MTSRILRWTSLESFGVDEVGHVHYFVICSYNVRNFFSLTKPLIIYNHSPPCIQVQIIHGTLDKNQYDITDSVCK